MFLSFSVCSLRVMKLCDDNERRILFSVSLIEAHFFYFIIFYFQKGKHLMKSTKKLTRTLLSALLILASIFTLSSCDFFQEKECTNHKWVGATCLHPAHCFYCNMYEPDGKLASHNFVEDNSGIIKCSECHILLSEYERQLNGETGEVEASSSENNETSESAVGLVENIYASADIPDELMNDKFKSVIDLLSKNFSQSGLDISDATKTDVGTYIFYFDGLEFLEDKCDDSHLRPRIIYDETAIENNGTPSKIFFGYYNPLKSNGYTETVAIVENIAKALDISTSGLINNDYSSSSTFAVGEYATFNFTNLKLKLTVTNTDGTVDIEIIPID